MKAPRLASGLLVLAMLALVAAPLPGLAQDEPGAAGFGIENRHSSTDTAISSDNVDRLGLAWTIPTQDFVSHWPLVDSANGRVYFADWGGTVYAADAETGEIAWQQQVEQNVMREWPWYGFAGTGALGEGMLFEASVEGTAYAINPQTGEVLWRTEFADDPQGGNLTKLLYHDGLVYLGVSSPEEVLDAMVPDFEPDFQGKVLALKAQSGEVVWERQLVEAPQTGVAVWSSFALDPGTNTLFFTTSNNYTPPASELSDAMVAVDAKTGEIRWATQVTEHDVWTTENPIGPDYAFGAGPQLFEATIDGQERRLVGAGQKSGIFFAFDRETGEIVWETTVGYGGSGGGIHAEAAIGQDAVYVWSNNSYMYSRPPGEVPLTVKALDDATGANLWVIPQAQPAAVPAAAFLANDVVFVGSLDGIVRGYRAADGRLLWTSGSHGPVAGAIAAVGDSLYFPVGVPQTFVGTAGPNGMVAYRLGAQAGTPAADASPTPFAAGTPIPGRGASTPIVVGTPEGGGMAPTVGEGTVVPGEGRGTPAAASAVTVETHSFSFAPDRFTIPAGGPTQVTVTNPSDVEHTFTVEELGIGVEVHPGETKTITVNAPAGEYGFYCEYHPDRMRGTLIVE